MKLIFQKLIVALNLALTNSIQIQHFSSRMCGSIIKEQIVFFKFISKSNGQVIKMKNCLFKTKNGWQPYAIVFFLL